jgi:hypothetical protein
MNSRIEAIKRMDSHLKYDFFKEMNPVKNVSPLSDSMRSSSDFLDISGTQHDGGESEPLLPKKDNKKNRKGNGAQDQKEIQGTKGIQNQKEIQETKGIQDKKEIQETKGIQDKEEIQEEKDIQDQEEIQEAEDIQEQKAMEEKYLDWLKKQNSVLYMQFIELVSEELNNDHFNKVARGNQFFHFLSILIATMSASSAYALDASGQSGSVIEFFSTTLGLVLEKIAMPAAILTLVVGSVMDVRHAYLDKNTLDRTFILFESLYQAILGTVALCISVGAIVTSPFVLPALFLGIVLGLAVKEYRQSTQAEEKIKTLKQENRIDMQTIDKIKGSSGYQQNSSNLEVIQKAEMRIAKREQEIAMLRVQKESAKRSMYIALAVGVTSIAFFFAAAAVPPLALLFTAIGLMLFLTLNHLITNQKNAALKEIEQIKLQPKYERKEDVVKDEKLTMTRTQFVGSEQLSGLSIFARNKNKRVEELDRIKTFRATPSFSV